MTQVFTPADLAQFNGKNGQRAYVAFNEKVYDVTGVFKNGEHAGVVAGVDITRTLRKAPHSEKVLATRKVIGTYAEA